MSVNEGIVGNNATFINLMTNVVLRAGSVRTPPLEDSDELYIMANISSFDLAIASAVEDTLIGYQAPNKPDFYNAHGHRPATYGPLDYFGNVSDSSGAMGWIRGEGRGHVLRYVRSIPFAIPHPSLPILCFAFDPRTPTSHPSLSFLSILSLLLPYFALAPRPWTGLPPFRPFTLARLLLPSFLSSLHRPPCAQPILFPPRPSLARLAFTAPRPFYLLLPRTLPFRPSLLVRSLSLSFLTFRANPTLFLPLPTPFFLPLTSAPVLASSFLRSFRPSTLHFMLAFAFTYPRSLPPFTSRLADRCVPSSLPILPSFLPAYAPPPTFRADLILVFLLRFSFFLVRHFRPVRLPSYLPFVSSFAFVRSCSYAPFVPSFLFRLRLPPPIFHFAVIFPSTAHCRLSSFLPPSLTLFIFTNPSFLPTDPSVAEAK
ncbi:hypothetical protein B0H11DRAFT_2369569 [Mycena galericulata]|nr:hypothetical protein B0H11DRAFT_2369569 [Mycena galericulata]